MINFFERLPRELGVRTASNAEIFGDFQIGLPGGGILNFMNIRKV
jgi:hypothetical protein